MDLGSATWHIYTCADIFVCGFGVYTEREIKYRRDANMYHIRRFSGG